MSDVTLGGLSVLACTVSLPAWGVWWADVEVGEADALTGAVVLELPGLTLSGTVVSGGPWQGRARYRVAGGAGRWGASVPAKSWASDAGVKRRTVLLDAAAACGETLDATTLLGTDTVGPQWARDAGPASRQLHLLAPRAWYVGEDGTTRIGARPATTVTGDATVMDRDEAGGWVELVAEDLSQLVPGVTAEGVTAVDVVHTLADGNLRTRLWAAHGTASRRLGALGRLVDGLTANLRYRGVWSYRVVAQSGERLDLQAERSSSGMPDLQRVMVRYPSGVKAEHTMGSMVLVAFVDGSPARPVVVAGDDPDSPGHIPVDLTIDATTDMALGDSADAIAIGAAPRLGVARTTDPVLCGGFAGTIQSGSIRITAGL